MQPPVNCLFRRYIKQYYIQLSMEAPVLKAVVEHNYVAEAVFFDKPSARGPSSGNYDRYFECTERLRMHQCLVSDQSGAIL